MDEAVQRTVKRWLAKAANDLRTAETMISVMPPVTDTACFHAQQCMEKGLKAYLTAVDRHVERTHHLPRLVELCAEQNAVFEQLVSAALELTDYAVQGRYPDDWREIPVDEAKAAVERAKEAMTLVAGELEKRNHE